MHPLRVGVVCDLAEEHWPSMDLVADKLVETLRRDFAGQIDVTALRPAMRRRFTRLPGFARRPRAGILDRLANRYFDYPRWLSRHAGRFDVFHIVDHSYAQLASKLPGGRAVVTCHDMDAFRCVLSPAQEPRSAVFRALTRRAIDGLRLAARVACPSAAVRDEVQATGLVPGDRLSVVPNGVDEVFSPEADPEGDAEAARLLGAARTDLDVLHVGSVIPRKRIDVLLGAVSAMARTNDRVRLVRVGGAFTSSQEQLAVRLGLSGRVVALPVLSARVLAAVYRRSAVCLLPSEREGFGLPVLEALACGTPAIASDLPALRETGGELARYCAVGDAEAFARAALACLDEQRNGGHVEYTRMRRAREHAARFTWRAYAAAMAGLYRAVAMRVAADPEARPT